MNTISAYIALGLFGWLGYAVWTGVFEAVGSGRSRGLGGLIQVATERFGPEATSIYLFAIAIILAFFFLIRAEQEVRP